MLTVDFPVKDKNFLRRYLTGFTANSMPAERLEKRLEMMPVGQAWNGQSPPFWDEGLIDHAAILSVP